MMKRIALVSGMTMVLATLTACGEVAPQSNGIQCKSSTSTFKFSKNAVSFLTTNKAAPQRYYALVSQSKQPFWLNMQHTGQGASASAGWDSLLNPGNMSILAMDKPKFTLVCNAMVNNKFQALDCSKVLTVCELQQPVVVKGRHTQTGSYWLKEDFK